MADPVRILLVSGSTRAASTNTTALVTAREVSRDAMTLVLYEGLAKLPAFNPDAAADERDLAVNDLRQQLAAADAVLFCTPEYAGTLPGSLKNLLDWTVGAGDLYGKPVAWINVANEGRGEGAHATLATVLGYVGAVVIESACAHIPVTRDAIGPDGTVAEPDTRDQIAAVCGEILRYLRGDVDASG